MSFKIITAANNSYILTLLDFINAFMQMNLNPASLVVYDLGLSEQNYKQLLNLQQNFNFSLKKLDYSQYPEHVDLNKFNGLYCSYAFKPIIIYNVTMIIFLFK